MSLTSFKHLLKRSALIVLLFLYGGTFYFLGKFSAIKKITDLRQPEISSIDQPIGHQEPSIDVQKGTVIGSFVKLCSNTVYGFELAYPKDWFTTYNTDNQKCAYFAPFSFVIPADSVNFQIPVKAEVIESLDWQETLKYYQNPNDLQNVLSSENIEVSGRSVLRVKAQTTANSQLGRGLLKVSYLIFDTNYPLVLTYQQLDSQEETNKYEDVIWEMVESLKYF